VPRPRPARRPVGQRPADGRDPRAAPRGRQPRGLRELAEYSLATRWRAIPPEVLEFLLELARVSKPAAEREFAELERFAEPVARLVGRRLLRRAPAQGAAAGVGGGTAAVLPDAARAGGPVHRGAPPVRRAHRRQPVGSRPTTRRAFLRRARPRRHAARRILPRPVRAAEEARRRVVWTSAWAASASPGRARCRSPTLVCNFRPPSATGRRLLTHYEVLTLFHEFGHGLPPLAHARGRAERGGHQRRALDAVELRASSWRTSRGATRCCRSSRRTSETGEPLPHDMLARLQASRTFQAGMQTVAPARVSRCSTSSCTPATRPPAPRIAETLAEVRETVSVLRRPSSNRFPHSFQHVFSGGYARAYYSYKWAEVLSADALRSVRGARRVRPGARRGASSRRSSSGAAAATRWKPFVEFRGRKPEIEPLLRQMGLAA